MTYTCRRTGETFATEAVSNSIHSAGYCDNVNPVAVLQDPIIIPASASSPGGIDTRARDASGNLITNQIGSQFWMDAEAVKNNQYSELDPTLAVKAVASDATYANAWIAEYAKLIAASGVDVSANVGALAAQDGASPVLKQFWDIAPETSPQAAYDRRLAETQTVSPTATGSGQTVPNSAANPGILTGATTTIGNYSTAILAVLAVIILGAMYILAKPRGATS